MLQLWWRWMMPPCVEHCKNKGGLGGGSMALIWQINGSFGRGVIKFQVRITYHKDISLRHADLTMVTRWSGIQQSNRKTIQVRGIINCRTMHIIMYRQRANIQPGAQFIDVCSFWVRVLPEIITFCGMDPSFWADFDPWQDEFRSRFQNSGDLVSPCKTFQLWRNTPAKHRSGTSPSGIFRSVYR
jgi:hypothetical protein